ncbi:hypothetical protein RIR_jg25106.t1 [Rhizophagus irregularis DAOM 181602=DAOM 197198]|nr:hypothetical protein RIR_jg25106.t1 [Rhizophagus irregularis DAOM 181602=DAOM 197198]
MKQLRIMSPLARNFSSLSGVLVLLSTSSGLVEDGIYNLNFLSEEQNELKVSDCKMDLNYLLNQILLLLFRII